MEHLRLPSIRHSDNHVQIPCISNQPYDGGDFATFPQRQGWNLNKALGHTPQSLPDNAILQNGVTASLSELQSFLQTWLYFGSLHGFFGDNVDVAKFVTPSKDGIKYLRTDFLLDTFQNWVKVHIDSKIPYYSHESPLLKASKKAYDQLVILKNTLFDVQNLADEKTILATAILGESLEVYIDDLFQIAPKLTPYSIIWWSDYYKFPFRSLFEERGWCPSVFKRLTCESYARPLASLYMCLNLRLPLDIHSHDACTPELCKTSKIDPETYKVLHIRESCDCPLLEIDNSVFDDILGASNLPLVEADPVANEHTVNMRIINSSTTKIPYVAVSHVWAHGFGNPNANALQACALRQISRLVQQLPRHDGEPENLVPFWIDTISVPITPPALKQRAMTLLRKPYMEAKHVLVLDRYLQSIPSKDLDMIEIHAYISCSAWMSRLWTLQEGRLTTSCWFQFEDQAVNLQSIFNQHEQYYNFLTTENGLMLRWIRTMWRATNDFSDWAPELKDVSRNPIIELRLMLESRSVSVASDESLCLFTLSGLDLSLVAHTVPSVTARMQAFWKYITPVPCGIIFSRYPQKMDIAGYHWAPISFLGQLEILDWAGSSDAGGQAN